MGLGVILSGAVACGGAVPLPPPVPNGGADPTPLAKCRVAADRTEPLVTEWPASEKARLEALLSNGAVAVEYSHCELHIVAGCSVTGSYAYERTTLSTDTTEIGNQDELYAKLPVGAIGLEGELQRYGRLAVRTTVAGQLKLTGASVASVPHDGACARATHIVTALSVGAYKLLAGGSSSAEAKLAVGSVGAGGRARHEEEIMREAGDPAACPNGNETAPDPACRSPLQIFLEPIPNPERDQREAAARQAEEDARRDSEERAARAHTMRTWSYVLGGVALGTGGVGLFGLLEGDASASSVKSGGFSSGGDIDSAVSRARFEHAVGVTSLIVAGVSLALAIPLYLVSGPPDPPQRVGKR